MEFVEFRGKTVDDAITNALVSLGTTSDQIEYEVIEKGSNGILGFGSKDAVIKVAKKSTPEDVVKDFLTEVFDKMNLEVEIITKFDEIEGVIDIELKGPEMGVLIGKRGQTLDSLQYLTNLAVNRKSDNYLRVKIDTEDYRRRRKETLENLAKNMAYKVKRTKRPVSLEAMNPYERRIIHTSVQKVNGAISWSEGENANRHVVIGPDPKAKPVRRNGGYNNRGRGGRRPYSANRSEHNTPANPDRKPLNEGGATGLYGRIDK